MPETPFTIHTINGYICNLFIAEYPEGMLLLDCGAVTDVERIERYCRETLQRPVTDIRLAVVSHMHPDHGGGAAVLREKYGIPLAAYHSCDRWYAGVSGFIQHRIDCYMAQMVRKQIGKKMAIHYRRKLKPDHMLHDNEVLPMFSDWRVLHVPGHTLHDIVLYNGREKILYGADIILNAGNKLNLPIPVFFPGKMKRSLKTLGALDLKKIYLAHGNAIGTDDAGTLFSSLLPLVDEPKNEIQRYYHRVSFFTPELWKSYLRKRVLIKKNP
ncbi:MAG TPA: MBL fold metallo-hydrolase [Spirochaetota bacterium]|nr:MBL fold metallo-hydrolase [Spirochaetota bacterium]HPQ54633.1 MBL fold metallo-hydrolase [Spirochaetota bacterium]